VKVPEDVEKESLKTLWLNRSHSLVVVGKKKQIEEEKLPEGKKVPEEEEHKDNDHENMHPLTFLLDHFGYPGFTHCRCQKKPEEEGKQRMLHIHKKGEPEPERKHKTLQKMEKPAAEKADEAAEEPQQPEEKPEEQKDAEDGAPAANSSASSEEWVKPSVQDCTPNQERDVPFEVKPYKITLDITGYDKDEVKVEKHGDKVTVHGEHNGEDAEDWKIEQ
jgi:HSP20 family molecular chaperone IbpA